MAKKRSDFYFPEELIFQVLAWLPVISLLRFRSVCKSWRSMILNPKFIENHLAISHKKEAHVLRFVTRRGDFNNTFYVDTRDVSFTIPLPLQFYGVRHFLGSCNGLVCFSRRRTGDVIYLWNPLTKRFKELTVPKIQARCALDLGFCFDCISKDYKILRIVLSDVTSVIEAELYSTNSNSWKEIQLPKTVGKVLPWGYSKCVSAKSGVLYFVNRKELLSFDSHNEVFGVYPFPDSMQHKRMSCVLEFNGSAAMLIESVCDDVSILSLWTLDDICGKVSWEKKFNFEAVNGIRWIHLYLGGGQFVSQYGFSGTHCFYDYKKKKTTKFHLPPLYRDSVRVYKLTESLVSLVGFERLD